MMLMVKINDYITDLVMDAIKRYFITTCQQFFGTLDLIKHGQIPTKISCLFFVISKIFH